MLVVTVAPSFVTFISSCVKSLDDSLKVKVKFDLVKGEGFNFGKSFMRLKAVMLLEDLPFPFDNVESF